MGKTREIVKRAMKDEAFRERLLSDAKATIQKEFGVEFPEAMTVRVHEDSPTVINLVLPPPLDLSTGRSLSEEELKQVAGGATTKPIMEFDTMKCVGPTSPFVCGPF